MDDYIFLIENKLLFILNYNAKLLLIMNNQRKTIILVSHDDEIKNQSANVVNL